jgi:hypothetical protein
MAEKSMKVLSLYQTYIIHLTDMRCVRAVRAEAVVLSQLIFFINANNATSGFKGPARSREMRC